MGGGRGKLILISTPAIVENGTTIANAKKIATENNFFIVLPPLYDPFREAYYVFIWSRTGCEKTRVSSHTRLYCRPHPVFFLKKTTIWILGIISFPDVFIIS
jgi:hypothetical protein